MLVTYLSLSSHFHDTHFMLVIFQGILITCLDIMFWEGTAVVLNVLIEMENEKCYYWYIATNCNSGLSFHFKFHPQQHIWSLTLKLPKVTKIEFLLTTTIYHIKKTRRVITLLPCKNGPQIWDEPLRRVKSNDPNSMKTLQTKLLVNELKINFKKYRTSNLEFCLSWSRELHDMSQKLGITSLTMAQINHQQSSPFQTLDIQLLTALCHNIVKEV